jgi:hypothetical protein
MKSLLETLADKACQRLFQNDPRSRHQILQSLAKTPLPNKPFSEEGSPGQLFTLICYKFPHTSEEEEPLIAAGFLISLYREAQPLPLLCEDPPLQFCAKTLVSLALFKTALTKRWTFRGAPHPNFYRETAKTYLKTLSPAHKALGQHHERWENFLHEQLLVAPINPVE